MEFRRIYDLQTLMDWRREVIEHVFGVTPDRALMDANANYYKRHVPDGSHHAFLAIDDGKEAGCGAVCLTEELPSPDNPTGKCGYLMNIYVRECCRQKGIGHLIVRHLINEAREAGCGKIYLETTEEGRPVYESLGFEDMEGMMKFAVKERL